MCCNPLTDIPGRSSRMWFSILDKSYLNLKGTLFTFRRMKAENSRPINQKSYNMLSKWDMKSQWQNFFESFYLGVIMFFASAGLNLAVFRDEAEQAHAIDAYCPHMGANLAAGGVVEGDCLTCPFHGWRFRGSDGKCTKIPYLAEEKSECIAEEKIFRTGHPRLGNIHAFVQQMLGTSIICSFSNIYR